MPKVLVISAHRVNRSPSQRYRYEQYIDYLQNNGFEFTFSPLLNEKDDVLFYSKGNVFLKMLVLVKSYFKRKKDAVRCKHFDVVLIQREALFTGNTFFEKAAFKSGAKVIFDFDDSIWLNDTSPANKKFAWLKNPNKLKIILSYAHLVISGNKYLSEYALTYNNNVIIIPTTINTEIHIPKPEYRNKEIITIGWSGSASTIKHFELLITVLKKLKEKYQNKIQFKVIGDKNYAHSELNIKGIAWNPLTEVNDLNTFDIGIMPLPDDEWSKGKCGLKGLSYMSCGIPTIMSRVGVNSEIINQKVNGYLAESEEEWIDYMSLLIENAELRNAIGNEGRKTVQHLYSTKANQEKYLLAFNSVLN